MEIKYILKDNYDQKEKINKNQIFCYSKKKLDELYPEGNYKIIGEISGKTINQNEIRPDQSILKFQDLNYIIDELGTANKFIYSRKSYISIGNDEFVVLLHNKVIFLFLISLISLLIIIMLGLIFCFGDNLLNPKPVIDPNISDMENDHSDKIESEQGGGSVSIAYTKEALLKLADNEIEMYLGNPNASNHQIVAELYIENGNQDSCIAKSGLINPGSELKLMTFNQSLSLSSGSYLGYYVLKFYNPETGELALVESYIENVVITVK